VASDLTLVECERVLIRAQALAAAAGARIEGARAQLHATAQRWNVLHLEPGVIERACRPFPGEPIRTLDALHLASVLRARDAVPELSLLSLDGRIRSTARALGVPVLPPA
jgi:hypothetical protein